MIGRHYGLATRLIDWSEIPSVALFFAVYGEPATEEDGKTPRPSFVIGTNGHRNFVSNIGEAPWDGPPYKEGAVFFLPDYVSERVFPQRSILCCWDDPTKTLKDVRPPTETWWFKIAPEAREDIQWDLAGRGITRESLFPGLEGAAAFLNWKTRFEEVLRYRRRETG